MTVTERSARVVDHLQWMTPARIECVLFRADTLLNAQPHGTTSVRLAIVVDSCLQLLGEMERAQTVSPMLLIGRVPTSLVCVK